MPSKWIPRNPKTELSTSIQDRELLIYKPSVCCFQSITVCWQVTIWCRPVLWFVLPKVTPKVLSHPQHQKETPKQSSDPIWDWIFRLKKKKKNDPLLSQIFLLRQIFEGIKKKVCIRIKKKNESIFLYKLSIL